MNKLVIISAGHGGSDPGAVGQGVAERDATIRITDRVAVLLSTWGMPFVQIPDSMGDLQQEIDWVNAKYKNVTDGLAIQVHLNAGGGTGTETWVPSNADAESVRQGTLINNALVKSIGLANRGIKYAQNSRFGKLGWTDDTNTYAILVECYFIDVDNVSTTNELKAAYGIASGICQYFGVEVGKTPEQIAADQAAEASRLAAEAAQKAKDDAIAAAKAAVAEAARKASEQKAADKEAQHQADHSFIERTKWILDWFINAITWWRKG